MPAPLPDTSDQIRWLPKSHLDSHGSPEDIDQAQEQFMRYEGFSRLPAIEPKIKAGAKLKGRNKVGEEKGSRFIGVTGLRMHVPKAPIEINP